MLLNILCITTVYKYVVYEIWWPFSVILQFFFFAVVCNVIERLLNVFRVEEYNKKKHHLMTLKVYIFFFLIAKNVSISLHIYFVKFASYKMQLYLKVLIFVMLQWMTKFQGNLIIFMYIIYIKVGWSENADIKKCTIFLVLNI
jgi:hypothetical protein